MMGIPSSRQEAIDEFEYAVAERLGMQESEPDDDPAWIEQQFATDVPAVETDLF
jgi:hypothetical protein